LTLTPAQVRQRLALILPESEIDHAMGLEPHRLAKLITVRVAPLVEQLRRREVEAPLSLCRLWTNAGAECDQLRQCVVSLQARLSVAMGGNRSGKTYGAFVLDVAVALGRHHPHAQALCRLNGIDPKLVPLGPGTVIIVAGSAGASRSFHRRQIAELLPPGAEWYGMNGLQEARVHIPVPGSTKVAIILFQSVDQGAKRFKGSEARRYHIDEEPEGEEGRAVLDECLRGASSVGGKVVITATPQAGYTWMIEDLVEGKDHDAQTTRINSLHNRLVKDYAGLVAWLEGMDEDERAMREKGEWIDRRGAVYETWRRAVHMVPAFTPPSSWLRFMGADYGQTAPTGIVWLAFDPVKRQLHLYRCMKEAGIPYEQWAERVHEAEGGVLNERGFYVGHDESIEQRWGDPASPEAIQTWNAMDLPTARAHKEVQTGLSSVRELLRVRASDGLPSVVVHEPTDENGTAAFVVEVEGYRYDQTRKGNVPIKEHDHLMDAWRYCVRGWQLWDGDFDIGQGADNGGTEDSDDGEE
jgi:hypothetical protein